MKMKARNLKRQVMVLYFAYRNPKTPFLAKLFVGCVVAYALSPIDLIPDFIPVLGYLDDLILIPLGIWYALKILPPAIVQDARIKADEYLNNGKPKNYLTAVIFVMIWICGAAGLSIWIYKGFF